MIKKLKAKLFSILPKSIRKSFYKFSGRVDSVGREIMVLIFVIVK